MSEKDIINIDLVKGVQLKNLHNNHIFPKSDILEVHFRNGDIRVLDLLSKKDFTEIDYYVYLKNKCKVRNIYKERED